jgi:hypothetical protein
MNSDAQNNTEKTNQLIDRNSRLLENAAQSPWRKLSMVGNDSGNRTSAGVLLNNNMTAFLANDLEALLAENFNQFAGRDDRQARHGLDSDFECCEIRGLGQWRNLFRVCGFQKKLDGLMEIFLRFFHAFSLTHDVQFRTISYVPIAFVFNDGRQIISHRVSCQKDITDDHSRQGCEFCSLK